LFDARFRNRAQRRSFREYLLGLLLPRDRNKTLTALASAEPITEAQAAPVQRLQFFLSEAQWDVPPITAQRLELLLADPATRPHAGGVLIIDETGDRKAGTHTDHVARQYLGSRGKVEPGIVAVSSLWADERVYYPLHVEPYTPASRLPKGKQDPAFRTKPVIGRQLVAAALAAGVVFRAIVADCGYGSNEAFVDALQQAGLPFVVALKPSQGTWAPVDAPHTPQEVAAQLPWEGPEAPGDWTKVERRFRDGHSETWWAAELTWAGYGPQQAVRLVVATTDPATLPEQSTWYLLTNLPAPGSPGAVETPEQVAELAEVVRLYGLRNWVEASYKQVKQELGWADFQVRQDRAIRRHWELVCCAFAFCWWHWLRPPPPARAENEAEDEAETEAAPVLPEGGKRRRSSDLDAGREGERCRALAQLAASDPSGPRVAGPLATIGALVAGLEPPASPTGSPSVAGLGRQRSSTPSYTATLI
jgi:SRSO17 transposase